MGGRVAGRDIPFLDAMKCGYFKETHLRSYLVTGHNSISTRLGIKNPSVLLLNISPDASIMLDIYLHTS